MGYAARAKQQRRQTATIEVVCPGLLQVLSVGRGDIKINVGPDPEDIARARTMIEGMLKAGYGIFVETDEGPRRVKSFNPQRMTYIVSEITEGELPTPAKPAARAKTRDRHLPVAGSRATAIGRTAGG